MALSRVKAIANNFQEAAEKNGHASFADIVKGSKLTKPQFADAYGLNTRVVKSWCEEGNQPTRGLPFLYMRLIQQAPEEIKGYVKNLPRRRKSVFIDDVVPSLNDAEFKEIFDVSRDTMQDYIDKNYTSTGKTGETLVALLTQFPNEMSALIETHARGVRAPQLEQAEASPL